MTLRVAVAVVLAGLLLAACTTHLAKYDSVANPVLVPPGPATATLEADAEALLLRYAEPSALPPTEGLALLTRAAADGYLAERDAIRGHARDLQQAARTFAATLRSRLTGRGTRSAFVPIGRGGPIDPSLTADAGEGFEDTFLATGDRTYANDARAALRSLMASRRTWLTGSPSTVGAAASEVTVAVFLERASDIDLSSSSTGIPPSRPDHREIVAQRVAADAAYAGAMSVFGRDLKARSPADLGELAREVLALEEPATRTVHARWADRAAAGAARFARMVSASGAPARNAVGDTAGASMCVAAAALVAGTPTLGELLTWATRHRRPDASLPLAADSDSVGQAYCGLAMERNVSLLLRGVLPQP